jgi:hypothetical protein
MVLAHDFHDEPRNVFPASHLPAPWPRAIVRESGETRALVSSLYRVAKFEDWDLLPHCRPLDHTMFDALDDYVTQKLPIAALYQALIDGVPIELHGIYPEHLPMVAAALGFSNLTEVPFAPHREGKRLNYVRPAYFRTHNESGGRLVIAVTPGREYLRHYAGLVRHFLFLHTSRAEELVKIVRYPEAERSIAVWTGLDRGFVRRGDTVVVGYVEEIAAELAAAGHFSCEVSVDNRYFVSRRYRIGSGRAVNLLGVKFSFWAGISGRLVAAFCRAGVSEIIYCGKLGSLSAPEDVYDRIFCPSRYFLMEHRRLVETVQPPPNPLLHKFSELDSAAHVSVPTVIEEDYIQRHAATAIEASSIDNEIAHMAAAVARHNAATCSQTAFAALHFATDYVRSFDERNLSVALNLSNNRTRVARERKQAVIARLCRSYLEPHLHD